MKNLEIGGFNADTWGDIELKTKSRDESDRALNDVEANKSKIEKTIKDLQMDLNRTGKEIQVKQ